jgi:hypothetical protein
MVEVRSWTCRLPAISKNEYIVIPSPITQSVYVLPAKTLLSRIELKTVQTLNTLCVD